MRPSYVKHMQRMHDDPQYREMHNAKRRAHWTANKEAMCSRQRARYHANPAYYNACTRAWIEKAKNDPGQVAKQKARRKRKYAENRETAIRATTEWIKSHPERHKAYNARWRANNQAEITRKRKARYALKKAERLEQQRAWRAANPEKYRAQWQRHYRQARLLCNCRGRLYKALRGQAKSASTLTLLGVSDIEQLWQHLESQFSKGMKRENYGSYWHVDHIHPCDDFDMSNPAHQRQCFHWTNLQPLTGAENLRKGARFEKNQLSLLLSAA